MTLALREDELCKLCKLLPNEGIILLQGDLGSGKTSLVKAKASQMGINTLVTSPSFALMQEYKDGKNTIYHYDIYNLNLASFMANGLFDNLFSPGLHMVEWGDASLASMLKKYALSYKEVKITLNNNIRSYEFE